MSSGENSTVDLELKSLPLKQPDRKALAYEKEVWRQWLKLFDPSLLLDVSNHEWEFSEASLRKQPPRASSRIGDPDPAVLV